MSWTQEDLSKVIQAQLDLVTGERVTSVTFSNGKRIDYAPVDLKTLQNLEAQINMSLGDLGGSPGYFRVTCDKGL